VMTLPKDNDEVSTWRMPAKPTMADLAKRGIPESWHCIDCGINTAPGCLGRAAYMATLKAMKEADAGWQRAMDKIAERAGRSKGPNMRRITPLRF